MPSSGTFDVTAQLAALKHEKKNHDLRRLPPHAQIRRRPINHGPVTAGHGDASISQVVYVSRRTPFIAAVKRVKKLLRGIMQRSLQDARAPGSLHAREKGPSIEAGAAMDLSKEHVLVKASGRAMEQALRVAEWFQNREKEFCCHVETRAGNVSVIDDIVAVDSEDEEEPAPQEGVSDDTKIDCGDTTLELLGGSLSGHDVPATARDSASASVENASGHRSLDASPTRGKGRRKKRKRPMYHTDELPEARSRWVKTVEVSISLRA